jgi:hypothetical protein
MTTTHLQQVCERTITLELVRIDIGFEEAVCLGLVAADEDGEWIDTPTRDELIKALREQDQAICPLLADAKRLADTKRQEQGWLDEPILLEVERFYREPDEPICFDFSDYHPGHYLPKRWLSLPLDPRFLTLGPPCRRDND